MLQAATDCWTSPKNGTALCLPLLRQQYLWEKKTQTVRAEDTRPQVGFDNSGSQSKKRWRQQRQTLSARGTPCNFLLFPGCSPSAKLASAARVNFCDML